MTDFKKALRTLESRAQLEAWTAEDAPSPWLDTFSAAWAGRRREELSSSAIDAWKRKVDERAKVIGELGGDEYLASWYATIPLPWRQELRQAMDEGRLENSAAWLALSHETPSGARGAERRSLALEAFMQVEEYRRRFPDRVRSDDELFDEFKHEAAALREREQYVIDRGSGVAEFLGAGAALMTDPLIVASLPLGFQGAGGRSLLQTFGRAAAIEGGIAMGVEIPIQAQVHAFKQEIEAPWTWQQSALNVVAAGAGGAIVGGGLATGIEGVRRTLARYRKAKADGTARVTPDTEDAAEALEQTVQLHERNPLTGEAREAAHEMALEVARRQTELGERVDVAHVVAGSEPSTPIGRALQELDNPAALLDLDPAALRVDAETFQFKAGAGALGVTDALQGVERFDRRLAGVVLVWERADGERFIADGHQRLALARRALAAGQPADEVRLNGFLLREADGISPGDARVIAAMKNMAEGTGSALDAARILREVGRLADLALPPLPPRSALVRQARGLAQLDDEAFRAIINEVIPENYGALVGQSTADPRLQQAMIEVLRRTRPANETQARSIVDQVRTQGVEVRTTEDLFGEQAIAESLYLERAQVLEATLREARTDRTTFGRLVAEADRIEETGANVLDRAANLQRIQEAKDAATQISRLANAKGPISDALGEAARRVKAGERPATAAAAVLDALRRELAGPDRGGLEGRAARPGRQAPAPVERQGPPPSPERLDPDAPNFGVVEHHTLPEGHRLLRETVTIDTPERQALRQRIVDQHFENKAAPRRPAGERPIVYFMAGGGASGKGTVKTALRNAGEIPDAARVVDIDADEIKALLPEYGEILRAGDSRAAAITHEESSLLARQIRERAQAEGFDIVADRTMGSGAKASKDIAEMRAAGYEVRVIGVTVDADTAMQRMVSRYNRAGRLVPPRELLAAHAGFSRDLDEIARLADELVLFDNNQALGEAPRLIARKAGDGIAVEDRFLYNRFREKGGISGQESTLRELREGLGRARDAGAPGARRAGEGRAPEATGRARRPAAHPVDDIDPGELERTIRAARDLVEDQGDLVQLSRLEADEIGQLTPTSRPAREVFGELDEIEHAYRNVGLCTFGGGA